MVTIGIRLMVCPQPRRLVQGLCLCMASLLCCSSSFAAYVELGPAASIALDQPRVAVEVYIPSPEQSFGPDISNTWLLDTAAQGLLSAGAATAEMKAEGFTTEGTFEELGLGGTTTYDVSAIYNFDFAGSDFVRKTLADVRILSSDTVNFGGFGGIVGMPAMVNRVTSMDLTPMAGLNFIGVEFPGSVPADAGHRYNANLSLNPYPASGDPPLPTYGPLPFLDVEFQHGSTTQSASLVLDTGAQKSLLSMQAALDLGLDTDEDGNFDNEQLYELIFSGADGTPVPVPILGVDKLVLPTNEGIDLIWTDVTIGIVDIDPSITGVFGSDILTSGYLGNLGVDNGYIERVHLDFTDSDNLNGLMCLDLNPNYDNVIPEPTALAGDVNGDGFVGGDDLTIILTYWGQSVTGREQGDLTGDLFVGGDDYTEVLTYWGTGIASAQSAPEPATLGLLLLGGLALLRRRRDAVKLLELCLFT